MIDITLHGHRILAAKDKCMIADKFCREIDGTRAVVVGPVATVADTLGTIVVASRINGTALDLNLGGMTSFGAADQLPERDTTCTFTSGYDAPVIIGCFDHVVRCEKAVSAAKVVRAVGQTVQS